MTDITMTEKTRRALKRYDQGNVNEEEKIQKS